LDLRGRKWQEAGEYCIIKSFTTLNCIRVIKIKEAEMGGACSTYGRDEKYIEYFG
jgi:hypothetical protein